MRFEVVHQDRQACNGMGGRKGWLGFLTQLLIGNVLVYGNTGTYTGRGKGKTG